MENLNITYKGMTPQPSDNLCDDGTMHLAVNAEIRGGSYHATRIPDEQYEVFSESGFEPLYVHDVAMDGKTKRYFIGIGNDGNERNWLMAICLGEYGQDEHHYIYEINNGDSLDNFTSLGNVVCFTLNTKLTFCRYTEGKYKMMEAKPPFLPLKFKTVRVLDEVRDGNKDESGHSSLGFSLPNWASCIPSGQKVRYFMEKPSDLNYTQKTYALKIKDEEWYQTLSNYMFGAHNKIHAALLEENRLMYPVLLRYALKLYDGSYTQLSQPILMMPLAKTSECDNPKNSGVIKGSKSLERTFNEISNVGKGRVPYDFLKVQFNYECYELWLDAFTDAAKAVIEKLKEDAWKDVVLSVDFFISPEIYTIDTNELDPNISVLKLREITDDENEDGAYRDESSGLLVKDIDSYWCSSPVFKTRNLWDEIKNAQNFHLIRSLTIDELSKLADGGKLLKDTDSSSYSDKLTNYIQNTTLETSLYDNSDLYCEVVKAYNSRLMLGNVKQEYPGLVSMEYLTPPIENVDNSVVLPDGYKTTDIYPYPAYGYGIEIRSERMSETIVLNHDEDKVCRIPAFMMYMNDNAKRMYVRIPTGYDNDGNVLNSIIRESAFTKSDLLTASYIITEQNTNYGSTSIHLFWKQSSSLTDIKGSKNRLQVHPSLLKASEVGNPFSFKDGNSINCGSGTLTAIAMNSQPISQGQFGQYPLFAFCSDGVYAVGIGSNGTIQNCVPYSTDVITDARSVANMGRDVVFASQNGIISIGSDGRQLLLPADIDFKYRWANDTQDLFIRNRAGRIGVGMPVMASLYDYITNGARIAYDYQNARLLVYNPNQWYTYIMDIASQSWSILDKRFVGNLNPVAECYMVEEKEQNDNMVKAVFDYSSPHVKESHGAVLVSRPIKFGAPDIMKTMYSLIQRGDIRNKDAAMQALYGSRDLVNWEPVWSSNDIYMRGFRGKPFKYYRIAVFLPNMTQAESISGFSASVAERMTDQLR